MTKDLINRANQLLSSANTKEQAAKKISAEFKAAAYVSRGSLWAMFADEKGVSKTVELA